jgi:hypothetical protein
MREVINDVNLRLLKLYTLKNIKILISLAGGKKLEIILNQAVDILVK